MEIFFNSVNSVLIAAYVAAELRAVCETVLDPE